MFSNAVKLVDLNDLNEDAQDCTNTSLYNKDKKKQGDGTEGTFIKVKKSGKKERSQISLSDCLSCSGCLSNEEVGFLKSQNGIEILNTAKKKKINIISFSLQSITALSVYFNLPINVVKNKLCYFFKSIHFDYVYDCSLSELIALVETRNEFVQYFYKKSPEFFTEENGELHEYLHHLDLCKCRNKIGNHINKKIQVSVATNQKPVSKVNSSNVLSIKSKSLVGNKQIERSLNGKLKNLKNEQGIKKQEITNHNLEKNIKKEILKKKKSDQGITKGDTINHNNSENNIKNEKFICPIICTHCSGTVIYGEKTFEENIIESFSKVKSSQQIQGFLLKFLHLQCGLQHINCLKYFLRYNVFDFYMNTFQSYAICKKQFLKNLNFLRGTVVPHNGKEQESEIDSLLNHCSLNIHDINHVCLLYCFDKKVEAVRTSSEEQKALKHNLKKYIQSELCEVNTENDQKKEEVILNHKGKKTKDKEKEKVEKVQFVDSVITSIELIELMKEMKIDFYALPECPLDNMYSLLLHSLSLGLHEQKYEKKGNVKEGKQIMKVPNNVKKKSSNEKMEMQKEVKEEPLVPIKTLNENMKSLKIFYDTNAMVTTLRSGYKMNWSMGYGEELFKFVCRKIFHYDIEDSFFNFKYQDVTVLSLLQNGECVFRVILSYGYRSMYEVMLLLNNGITNNNFSSEVEKRIIKKTEINEKMGNERGKDSCANQDISHIDKYQTNFEVKVTHDLEIVGRIDYVELMACENGCLFGCAQNIFSEKVNKNYACVCHNLNILKQINQRENIENLDFISESENSDENQTNGESVFKSNYKCECGKERKIQKESSKSSINKETIEKETNMFYENLNRPPIIDFDNISKYDLFSSLDTMMHNDDYSIYVDSEFCAADSSVQRTLKNVHRIFDTNNFNIMKNTFSSKKNINITNW